MLIFAGHHVNNQGALNSVSSEFVESSILGALVSSDLNSIFVGSATIKEKIKIINTTCDSLNIDIHYTTSTEGVDGPKVYYKDKCEQSRVAANLVQGELNLVSGFNNTAAIGYYHNKKEFGYDYFLKNSQPSIIVCPEHWKNYTTIILNRNKYSGAIQAGISKLIR